LSGVGGLTAGAAGACWAEHAISAEGGDMISADLTGKTALITGAASGIGLAAVEIFSRCGATVALNHLPDDPRGAAAVERLKAEGRRVVAAAGDVARPGRPSGWWRARSMRWAGSIF